MRLFFVSDLFEADGEDAGDAFFGHGDAIDDIGASDGVLIMGNDEELGLGEETLEGLDEASDIGVVEGGIELIEEGEWARFDHIDGEEESDGGHGAFATGEEGDVLEAFSWGSGDDIDAAFEDILAIEEEELSLTAIEEAFEHGLEVGIGLFEGLFEEVCGLFVDASDEVEDFGLAVGEVFFLGGEEGVSFFELLVFFDGDEVDGPEFFDGGLDFLDARFHGLG